MEMETIFFSWLVFSVIVGVLANQRGREGIAWGFLAACISPLLAGILLFFVYPDLKVKKKEEEQKRQEKLIAESSITGADFMLSMDKLHQLHQKKVLSDIEYIARKKKIISDLSNQILTQTPENFLGDIIPLLDNNILTQDEMQKIKEVVFNKRSRLR